MENKFEGRFEQFVSVEYKNDAPFARTIIAEKDSVKGERVTCLVAKLNEINSEVCTSPELLKNRTDGQICIFGIERECVIKNDCDYRLKNNMCSKYYLSKIIPIKVLNSIERLSFSSIKNYVAKTIGAK